MGESDGEAEQTNAESSAPTEPVESAMRPSRKATPSFSRVLGPVVWIVALVTVLGILPSEIAKARQEFVREPTVETAARMSANIVEFVVVALAANSVVYALPLALAIWALWRGLGRAAAKRDSRTPPEAVGTTNNVQSGVVRVEGPTANRRTESADRPARHQRYRVLVYAATVVGGCLMIGVLTTTILLLYPSDRTATGSPSAPAPLDSPAFDSWQRLSPRDRSRVEQILVGTMRDPQFLTAPVHQEFWQLLDKGAGSDVRGRRDIDRAIRPMRQRLTALILGYQRLFWEDARSALATGRPTKSIEREQYEKRLLAEQRITEWRIRESERLIERIANRLPCDVGSGTTTVLDEAAVDEILLGLRASAQRVERLWTRPSDPSASAAVSPR